MDATYEDGFRAGVATTCAIALDLENRWRRSAEKVRKDGTFKTGWPFRSTFVARRFEQAARDMEAAANGIAAIRRIAQEQTPTDAGGTKAAPLAPHAG